MAPSSYALSDAIAQFISISGSSTAVAEHFIKKHKNNVTLAIDDYFDHPEIAAKIDTDANKTKKNTKVKAPASLVKLFETYKEPEPDAVGNNYIGIDGTIQYIQDLGYEPEDIAMLPLAEFLESPTVGVFREDAFLKKWTQVQCTTIAQMKHHIEKMALQLDTDPQFYKKVYQFAFKFNLEKGDKKLAYDTAIMNWRLLIPSTYKSELELFIKFIENEYQKDITGDQWNMLPLFLEQMKKDPTFASFDESQSWPVLYDTFVEWVSEQSGQ